MFNFNVDSIRWIGKLLKIKCLRTARCEIFQTL